MKRSKADGTVGIRPPDDLLEFRPTRLVNTCVVCQQKDRTMIDIELNHDTEFSYHWIHPKCLQRLTLD